MEETLAALGAPLDLVWLDFGGGKDLGRIFELLWPRVRAGGLIVIHSTLTNA